jgi:hypothetical protein
LGNAFGHSHSWLIHGP